MNKINIAIADDHKLFREGLRSIIESYPVFKVIKDFSNGEDLIEYINKNPDLIDVLILDIQMPEKNGFEVLKELKKNKKPKTLVISMHEEDAYIKTCAKLGAYGYLLKNTDEDELIFAIKEIEQGNKYFNQSVASKLVNSILAEDESKMLTARELDVLNHLSKGLSNKEIADKLFISTRTVDTHRFNMLKKMKVKNILELIREAAKQNLINYM